MRISHSLSHQEKLTDRTFPTEEENMTAREEYEMNGEGPIKTMKSMLEDEMEEEESSVGVGLNNLASPLEGYYITNMKNDFEQELPHKLSEFN